MPWNLAWYLAGSKDIPVSLSLLPKSESRCRPTSFTKSAAPLLVYFSRGRLTVMSVGAANLR